MDDLICPYCEYDCGQPDDCHEPDENFEWECNKCKKNFIFIITYYPDYESTKADCLNGKKHKYKPIEGVPREFFKNKFRCVDCGKEEVRKSKSKVQKR